MTEKIRGNSVLPARREPITLETADGVNLVGELALPLEGDPVATMICLHPLPTHGGMMDSHLFRKGKYYGINAQGRAMLDLQRKVWTEFSTTMNNLLTGEAA